MRILEALRGLCSRESASPVDATLVVGLGNPGPKYRGTRHNVGFMLADRLAARWGVSIDRARHLSLVGSGKATGGRVILALPQTYMNRSGEAVSRLLRYGGLGPEDLVVLHDDLDLPLGTVRVKAGGGHGGHNGLRSLMDSLGTGEFRRVKVGIGRPAPGRTAEGWVLEPFGPDERPVMEEALDRAADEVDRLLTTK